MRQTTARKFFIHLLFSAGLLLQCMSLSAETIYLKEGKPIDGKIIEYTATSISIKTLKDGKKQIPLSEINLITFEGALLKGNDKQQEVSTLYLQNGEIIKGKITQYSLDFVTLESLSGHGVLQIPTSEINLISADIGKMDLNQRTAVGYMQQKSTLNSNSGPSSYSSDQISYKVFLERDLFMNILLAFGDATYNGNQLKVFALDLKAGMIFDQVQNTFLYYGASGGILQITDDAAGVSGSGYSVRAFVGGEMFFPSLPNFGFSGEIGLGIKNAGDYKSTDISTSAFPTFGMHYYF